MFAKFVASFLFKSNLHFAVCEMCTNNVLATGGVNEAESLLLFFFCFSKKAAHNIAATHKKTNYDLLYEKFQVWLLKMAWNVVVNVAVINHIF